MSAEACRAKYSISGFSRNIQDPSAAIDQRPQHKRDSAQASAEDCRAKQSISGFSRNSRDPKQLSIGLSTSVLPRKRQQKLVERSNRQAASAETVEFRSKQSIGGFSTSASRSLSRGNRTTASAETIELHPKQSSSGKQDPPLSMAPPICWVLTAM